MKNDKQNHRRATMAGVGCWRLTSDSTSSLHVDIQPFVAKQGNDWQLPGVCSTSKGCPANVIHLDGVGSLDNIPVKKGTGMVDSAQRDINPNQQVISTAVPSTCSSNTATLRMSPVRQASCRACCNKGSSTIGRPARLNQGTGAKLSVSASSLGAFAGCCSTVLEASGKGDAIVLLGRAEGSGEVERAVLVEGGRDEA
jgi:hypothetical protein